MLATIRRNTMRSAVLGLALASVVTTGALSANPAEAAAFVKLGDIRAETPTSVVEYEKASPKMVEEDEAVVLDDLDKSTPKMVEEGEAVVLDDLHCTKEITVTVRGQLDGADTVYLVFPKVEIAETATFVDDLDKSTPKIGEVADAVELESFEEINCTKDISVTVRGELNGSGAVDPVFPKVEIAETAMSVDDLDKSSPKMTEDVVDNHGYDMTEDTEGVIPKLEIAQTPTSVDEYDKAPPRMTEDFEMTEDTEGVFPKVEIVEPPTSGAGIEFDKSSPDLVFPKVEVMKPGGATGIVVDEVHADTLKNVQ